MALACSSRDSLSSWVIPGFDSLKALFKRAPQNAPTDCPEYEAKQTSLEVLSIADDHQVNVSRSVGLTSEVVGVAGRASPEVRVGRREDDMVRIGPVVMQALPDANRTFRDVGLRAAQFMHLKVFVGA